MTRQNGSSIFQSMIPTRTVTLVRLNRVSMRQPDPVNVSEIFADLPWVGDESVALGMLHLEMRGRIFRHGCEHQNRATLIGLTQQGNQLRPRPRKIHEVYFEVPFELRIIFEQADYFGAAGAEVSFALILKIMFNEIQLIVFHGVGWC